MNASPYTEKRPAGNQKDVVGRLSRVRLTFQPELV